MYKIIFWLFIRAIEHFIGISIISKIPLCDIINKLIRVCVIEVGINRYNRNLPTFNKYNII